MTQATVIRSRFTTVAETAKVLGVSPRRTKQLLKIFEASRSGKSNVKSHKKAMAKTRSRVKFKGRGPTKGTSKSLKRSYASKKARARSGNRSRRKRLS